uniref:Uncharacterized protein n=1 Tax=Ditylenchus dipsaci TaxID=166011 RepID=A0A915EBJ6_9BILA
MYDKAYAYLDAKCRFKESDTSEGRRRMVYALLKKKQAWDYSPPGGSSDAKKHEPSTEASAEKKTAITKSQS